MISKESLANLGLGKMLGAAWVIFTTVFFLLSIFVPQILRAPLAQQAAVQNSFQNGAANGYQSAVVELVNSLGTQLQGGCKNLVPVTVGTGSIQILSANCLEPIFQAAMAAQQNQGAPSPAPGN